MQRRSFIGNMLKPVSMLATACVAAPPLVDNASAKVTDTQAAATPSAPVNSKAHLILNPLAVAQASFHRMFKSGELTLEKFPQFVTSTCGLTRVQWSARLLPGMTPESAKALRATCDNQGLRSLLLDPAIGIGLTSSDAAVSRAAVEKLKPWCAIATTLSCTGLAIDLRGSGTYEEQLPRAIDGANLAFKLANEAGLPLVVQSLGGMTSNATFMAALMMQLKNAAIRLEPTFDSWQVSDTDTYNRTRGFEMLIPYAATVLADYLAFAANGDSVNFKTDFLMSAVRKSTFRGPVTILYKGPANEVDGVLQAKKVLIKYKCTA